MVAGVANINLGSLHYYFSSKEALYLAVFQRRGLPMVAERIHLLTQAQAKYGKRAVPRARTHPLLRIGVQWLGMRSALVCSEPGSGACRWTGTAV